MKNNEFLGSGLKFPIQVNKATGRFIMSSGETSVKESLYIILMTQKEERWIHPEFGSRILSYTFMDTSLTRINMLAKDLEQTILSQEPRISEVDIDVNPRLDKGCLLINISYTIAQTNARDNMVFPFYLYSGTEEQENEGTESL